MSTRPEKHTIRAVYDDATIRVYQAYSDEIASAALSHGRFVSPPFKTGRMTWIKPSFLWMMYRAGWGFKDEGQRRILGVDISRTGLGWALDNACPSRRPPRVSDQEWEDLKANAPVRIQWDPERDLQLAALPSRTIQIGLGGEAVERYVSDWTVRITDLTGLAHEIHRLLLDGCVKDARALLPQEREYPH